MEVLSLSKAMLSEVVLSTLSTHRFGGCDEGYLFADAWFCNILIMVAFLRWQWWLPNMRKMNKNS
jgi:hypothetical protein